jgi:ATP-dependent DNA helicase PIF1
MSDSSIIQEKKGIELSPEQEEALSAFKDGHNVFLTGPGGTGKTALIKEMVDYCNKSHQERKIQVCALTGCAAVLLNCKAKTIHSWSGIGLANGPADLIIKRVAGNKYKSANWKKVDVLIIDEVSMMSQKIFEILDGIGRSVRKMKSHLPFGGIQIVFSGDFYQLPPVMREEDIEDDPTAAAFCFESPHWPTTFHVEVQLKKIFRQTDAVYTKILNQIRKGKLYKSSLELLKPHIGKSLPATFVPTILLPRRRETEIINASELKKLEGEEKRYKLTPVEGLPEKTFVSNTNITPEQRDMELKYLMNNVLADKELILKKGTQVMCIANIDMESSNPIVNGSQGIVDSFIGELPVIKFNNGSKQTIGYHTWNSENISTIGIKQIPLIYAWAITIHKSQGVSLDMAQIDAGSNIFECGQTYVALSRIKSIDGLYLTAFNPQKIKVNKKVQDFYEALDKK